MTVERGQELGILGLRSLHTFPRLHGRLESLHLERQTLAIGWLSVHARRLSDAHLLLVGDATGYYDPFTGEGIYRALRTARLMADVALPALARDDLSAASLGAYDRSHHETCFGKHTVEQIFQRAVQTPFLMNISHVRCMDEREWPTQ